MKEFSVSKYEEGRRLDKYIMNILKLAPSSFVYKMLRKKNIVLNGGKATGKELLSSGDSVRFYLSDETFDRFSKEGGPDIKDIGTMPDIVYEDEDVIIVNKPAGMLTQRSSATDVSLNEICLSYVKRKGALKGGSFTPSVCNRLDRNTSGLVTFAVSYRAARILSEAFRKRIPGKYYKCVVSGVLRNEMKLSGYLIKDDDTNTVRITDGSMGGARIETEISPVRDNGKLTLLDVKLITGKTHQIRAHLSAAHFPIVGDTKYGDTSVNRYMRDKYGIRSQLLVCDRLVFPEGFPLPALSGRSFSIDVPDDFSKVM